MRRAKATISLLLLALAGLTLLAFPQTQVQSPSITPFNNLPQMVSAANVQASGNPGRTPYYYWIVAKFTLGNSAPAGPFQISQGADSLSGSNYNIISWLPTTGATSYDVLRTSTPAAPSGAFNCAVATGVTTTTVNDQANALNAYTVATFDPNKLNAQASITVGQAISIGGATCPTDPDGTPEQPWLTTKDNTGTIHVVACTDPETGNITFLPNTCITDQNGKTINCQSIVQPNLTANVSQLSFPTTTVGESASPQTVTVNNVSSVAATGLGVSLSDTIDYSQSNNCGASLAALSSC